MHHPDGIKGYTKVSRYAYEHKLGRGKPAGKAAKKQRGGEGDDLSHEQGQ